MSNGVFDLQRVQSASIRDQLVAMTQGVATSTVGQIQGFTRTSEIINKVRAILGVAAIEGQTQRFAIQGSIKVAEINASLRRQELGLVLPLAEIQSQTFLRFQEIVSIKERAINSVNARARVDIKELDTQGQIEVARQQRKRAKSSSFFDFLGKAAGGVAGFALGGPAGAAIGSGVGGAIS